MTMHRRDFLRAAAAAGATSALAGCASLASGPSAGRVVVVGGGYGGATAAKYVRLWSGGAIDVTLVEPNEAFVSCPLSNLVLGGSKTLADITVPYDGLARHHGVKVVRDIATAIDTEKKVVRIAGGESLPYDRLVLSPGVDFQTFPGLNTVQAQETFLHAWKAGPQTVALRRQLEAMPDGGVYAIVIPVAPYRCPPGPYERACQVAWYFKRAKPKSKVLILDANPDVTSKAALFKQAWAEQYKGIVEYRNNYVATGLDAASRTVKFETAEDVKADVLNVIPPQRAGDIARQAGLITANNRWCEVDFTTFESVKVEERPRARRCNPDRAGDAQVGPHGQPARQGGRGRDRRAADGPGGRTPTPMLTNTCYSFVTDKDVMHVASVHQYDRDKKTFIAVQGAGGLSPTWTPLEGEYAFSWARNIWADALA